MAHPDNYPVAIKVPEGPVTVEGTRRNARMLIEYVEGWLGGRGAKSIDSLEGKPGFIQRSWRISRPAACRSRRSPSASSIARATPALAPRTTRYW